ncbi:MAG: RluA family pseudouridine synthase [Clostridia bacterium]|nr:RluA family pseudouridine synthase [Clostridia bacterium]
MDSKRVLTFTVEQGDEGERLDKSICAFAPELSRSFVQKVLDDGGVTVNGRVRKKSYPVEVGDFVEIVAPELKEIEAVPQNIPLDIRYEDESLLVVNKPRGMVVHPAPGNPDGTLVNALMYHCKGSLSGINGVIRPGIVHRIDKNTSGLLMVAKTDEAHVSLAMQIQQHSFTREYRAVVHGHLKEPVGTVDAPIGRNPNDRKKMCVTAVNSRNAVTHYEVLETYKNFSFVRVRLETGRTHQIRVHMAHLGHPVAGDDVYGPKNGVSMGGQCLHAGLIGFVHPKTKEYIELSSELPDYFTAFLDRISKQ